MDRLAPESPTYNIPSALPPARAARAGGARRRPGRGRAPPRGAAHADRRRRARRAGAGGRSAAADRHRCRSPTSPACRRRAGRRSSPRSPAARPAAASTSGATRCSAPRWSGSDEDEHAFLFTLHHIASDGWSEGVLRRELSALYAAALAGEPSPLAPLALQYADFAAWQRAWPEEALAAQLAHWKERLAGTPAAQPPRRPPAAAGRELPRRLPAARPAAGARRCPPPPGAARPGDRLHDRPRRLARPPPAPLRADRLRRRHAGREPHPAGAGAAHRRLPQHARPAHRRRRRSELRRAPGAGAADGAGGVRPRRHPLRAHRGRGQRRARPQPPAAGADDARAQQHAAGPVRPCAASRSSRSTSPPGSPAST